MVGGVCLQSGRIRVAIHERVARFDGIGLARKAVHPVRRVEDERIPALRPPALGHLPAFDDDVIDPVSGEVEAHTQTGLAAADHEGVEPLSVLSHRNEFSAARPCLLHKSA